MAFWNRDEDSEWKQYQKSAKKQEQPTDFKASSESEPAEKGEPILQHLKNVFFNHENSEEPAGPPVLCPWCGKEMEKGYLKSRQYGIEWVKKKTFFITRSEDICDEGFWEKYKSAYYCRNCCKMTLDVVLTSEQTSEADKAPQKETSTEENAHK